MASNETLARNAANGRNIEPGTNSGILRITWNVPSAWLENNQNTTLSLKATFMLANQHETNVTSEDPSNTPQACARAAELGSKQVLVFGRETPLTVPTGCNVTRIPNPRLSLNPAYLTPGNLQFGQGGNDETLALTSDLNGNTVAVGRTTGVLAGAALGNSDFWITKFAPNSNQPLWAHQDGSSGPDELNAVTTDADGNIYAVGSSNSDSLFLKYSSAGNLLWKSDLAGVRLPSESISLKALALDANNGSLYVAGEAIKPGDNAKRSIVIRAKATDGSGTWAWRNTPINAASTRDSGITALAITPDGELFAAGNFYQMGFLLSFGQNLTSPSTTLELSNIATPVGGGVSNESVITSMVATPVRFADCQNSFKPPGCQFGKIVIGGYLRNAKIDASTPSPKTIQAAANSIGFIAAYPADSSSFTPVRDSLQAFATPNQDLQINAVQVSNIGIYAVGTGSLGNTQHGFLAAGGVNGWKQDLNSSSNDGANSLSFRSRYGQRDLLLVGGWTTGNLDPYQNQGGKDAVIGQFTLQGR